MKFLGVIVYAGLLVSTTAPVSAQRGAAPPPDLSKLNVDLKVTRKSLADIVAALTPMIRHGIIVDGIPMLQSADLDLHCTALEALDKIADAFDYRWSLSRSGQVMMLKRFHNPDDRPQSNPRELIEVARDARRVLTAIPYGRDNGTRNLMTLGASFSRGQLTQLQSGKFFRLADLPPQQQRLMLDCILNQQFAHALWAWSHLNEHLLHFEVSYLCAGIQDSQLGSSAETAPSFTFRYYNTGADNKLKSVIILTHPAEKGSDQ